MDLKEQFAGVCRVAEEQADRVRRIEGELFAEQLRLAVLNAARARLLRKTLGSDGIDRTSDGKS